MNRTAAAGPTPAPTRTGLLLAVSAVLTVAVFLASIATGSVALPIGEVVAILLDAEAGSPGHREIVWHLRMPKAITAALAGAALAVSGLLMQTLFHNPLAGPFVLGINSGASLGVALVLLAVGGPGGAVLSGFGLAGQFSLVAAAISGSVAVLLLVLVAARRVDTLTLLVLGVLFGYATSALVSVLLRFSVAEQIQVYVEWGFGSFGGVTWEQLRLFAPLAILGLLFSSSITKALNALLLGETYARSMGLAVTRARLGIIAATALLAGSVTAFCGPIAFLGVAVPHLGRGLLRSVDHRLLVPAVALLGAGVALLADLVAQVPGSPTVLPLNAITALVGAPVIVWIILRRPALRGTF